MPNTKPCGGAQASALQELVLGIPGETLTHTHSVWTEVRDITGSSGAGHLQGGEEKRQ